MDQLKLSFDPLTIEHLGVKMYSHLPNAVAELVANAYDADATVVRVVVHADASGESLSVEDDGHGMSYEDFQDKYLRIGRNRRDGGSEMSEGGSRRVSGKKGLGKLALFGIGSLISVSSKRRGATSGTKMTLRWNDILTTAGTDYYPEAVEYEAPIEDQGTQILLSELKRATPIVAEDLAVSLSRLFNYSDSGFQVSVIGADGEEHVISADSRLVSVEIESMWSIPADVDPSRHAYLTEHGVNGVIIASEKPLPQAMRGVALYASGRLLNEPEFYGASESSYAYSYISGYLNVDFLDDLVPDVISTDRRTIDWDTAQTTELREELRQLMFTVESQRRELRKEAKKKIIETRLPVDIKTWVDTVQTGPAREALAGILESLSSPDVEMESDEQRSFIGFLNDIVPPYADLHWRTLHPQTQDAAGTAYKEARYYDAVDEAIKRYITSVRTRAGVTASDAADIVNLAFSKTGKLSVFTKYAEMADFSFSEQTTGNVEEGQRSMSAGIVSGFRNPLAHEEKEKLHESGAFNHLDCLDALSIVSHLHRRLDDSIDRPPSP